MQYPTNELIDRYTILGLKNERIEGVDYAKELKVYSNEIKKRALEKDITIEELATFIEKLYEVNGKIWDAESDLRMGKIDNSGDSVIAQASILVRNLNRERNILKNIICDIFDDGVPEVRENILANPEK